MTPTLFQIVTHTPTWVWGLLALLVALGLMQTRTRTVARRRLVALPVAMGAWSLASALGLVAAQGATALVVTVLAWLAGLAAALTLGHAIPRPATAASHTPRRSQVIVPGSWTPLGLMLAIFATRYVVNVVVAIAPAAATDPAFAAIAGLAYGTLSGALLARALRLLGRGDGARDPLGLAAPAA